MSARRDNRRPPSGKVHRSEPGVPNLNKTAPARPSTAVKKNNDAPRPSTSGLYRNEFSDPVSRGRTGNNKSDDFATSRPLSNRPEADNSNLFSRQRPASSTGIRSDRSNTFGFTQADQQAANNRQNNQTTEINNHHHTHSARSDVSELSTNEILRRMREKSDVAKNQVDFAAIEALGDYNYFSRPKSSAALPLRTVLLDPDINNFPRSRTRTELLRKIKASGVPHSSYDLDMDGYVSQHDYRLAKRFDFDGNGVLDPDERNVGKQILADEFFKRHSHDLNNFGANLANNDHSKNVQKLVNSYSFEHSYDKLLKIERKLDAESSKPIILCMKANVSEDVLKHNYYTNKFDSTAWNDLEGIPRTASAGGLSNHGGSRKKLLFARTELMRSDLQNRMDSQPFKTLLPVVNSRRVNMITDPKFEND